MKEKKDVLTVCVYSKISKFIKKGRVGNFGGTSAALRRHFGGTDKILEPSLRVLRTLTLLRFWEAHM